MLSRYPATRLATHRRRGGTCDNRQVNLSLGDPTVQGALLGLLGVVLVALAGLGGVVIGGRISASASREAARIAAEAAHETAAVAQHEAEADRADAATARQEAREDARQARFADQKRLVYTDLWIACDRHKREVEAQVAWRREVAIGQGGEDPGIGPSEPARLAFLALTLLAPFNVVAAAEALYHSTTVLGARHADVRREGNAISEPDEPGWLRDLNAWSEAAAAFENEATRDLAN